MIYITGDTHGLKDISKFETDFFKAKINKKGNFVIVTGDFGVTWNNEIMQKCIEFYSQFNCTFLFVDGNNENFDILNSLQIEDFCKGKVHRVSKNILHLMRGYVFEIEGKKIFAFGGADSWDRCRKFVFDKNKFYPGKGNRTAHINWWKEEQPTKQEFELALQNLSKHGFKVDVIVTHETTTKNVQQYFYWSTPWKTCKMLDIIFKHTNFKHWYFGHHHYDITVSSVESCIFNQFISLENIKNNKFKSEYETLAKNKISKKINISDDEIF